MIPTTLFLSQCGVRPDIATVYAAPLAAACQYGGITSRLQVSGFVAEALHESMFFTKMEENMSYSAARLMAVWPRRFPTLALAQQYERNPQKLANFVYGGRADLGNAPLPSNDGWDFRGSGLLQCTGKANFQAADTYLGTAYTYNPNLPRTVPADAVRISTWFWYAKGLNTLIATGGIDAVSHKINPYDSADATAKRHQLFDHCFSFATD